MQHQNSRTATLSSTCAVTARRATTILTGGELVGLRRPEGQGRPRTTLVALVGPINEKGGGKDERADKPCPVVFRPVTVAVDLSQ